MLLAATSRAAEAPVRTPTLPAGRLATGWTRRLTALRTSRAGLLTLTLVAVAFHWLIGAVTRLVTGHQDYAGLGRGGNRTCRHWGPGSSS